MPVHLSHRPWPDGARWFVLYGGVGDVPLQNITGKARLAEFQGAIPGRPTRSAFELTLIGKDLGELSFENEQPIYVLRQSTIGTVELRAFGAVVSVTMDRPGLIPFSYPGSGYETRWQLSCSTVYRQMQNTYLPDEGYLRSEEEYAADRLDWLIDQVNIDTPLQISFPTVLRLADGILMLAPDDLDQKYEENLGGQSVADAINEICAYGELEWAFDKPTLTGYSNPPGISDPMDPDWWPVLDENPARSTIRVWSAIDGPPSLKDEEEDPPITIVNVGGFDVSAFPHLIPARELSMAIDTDSIATQAKVFYNGGTVVVNLDPEGRGVFPIRITTFDTLTADAATSIGRTQLATRCRANRTGQAVVPYHPRWRVGYKVNYVQAHDWDPVGEYFGSNSAIIRDVTLQWSENDNGDPTWVSLSFGSDPYQAPTLPKPVTKVDGGEDYVIPGLNDLRADFEHLADLFNQGSGGVAQFVAVFNGNGAEIPNDSRLLMPVAFDAKIENWTLVSDGTITLTVERGSDMLVYTDISGTGDPSRGSAGRTQSATPPAGWNALGLVSGNTLRITKTAGTATNATLSINVRKK